MIDVSEYGVVPSPEANKVDNHAALTALLAALESSTELESGEARRFRGHHLFFPSSTDPYWFSDTISVSLYKNLRLSSVTGHTGAWLRAYNGATRLFDIGGNAGAFHSIEMENLSLGGQVRVQANSRGWHDFRRVRWYNVGVVPLLLDSVDGQRGSQGGQVGGRVTDCEWVKCAGALQCVGEQADNWIVTGGQVSKCSGAFAFETNSTGWKFRDIYFEQKAGASGSCWLNLRGPGLCTIEGCRFGNEVSGIYEPPEVMIVLGDQEAAEVGHMRHVRLQNNWFEGRGDTGPSSTSARTAIQIHKTCNGLLVANSYRAYNDCLVELDHAETDDGQAVFFAYGPGGVTPRFNVAPDVGWTIIGE